MKYEAKPALLFQLCFVKLCAYKILSATMKCDFTKCYHLMTERMKKQNKSNLKLRLGQTEEVISTFT